MGARKKRHYTINREHPYRTYAKAQNCVLRLTEWADLLNIDALDIEIDLKRGLTMDDILKHHLRRSRY